MYIYIYKKKYKKFIEELNLKYSEKQEIRPSNNIWIYWHQGLESAPDIVKICVESIKSKYKDSNVTIITKDNVDQYLFIPDRIKKNIEKGKLTLTSFSDYLRLGLLKKYGGTWIDATCFINKKVDLTQYSFYSIHHDLYSNWHVCRGKWTGFFLYAIKNDNFISFAFDFMDNYLKTHNRYPTYLWIDCIFRIAYETNECIKEEIDKVPVNNSKVFELSEFMKNEEDINNFKFNQEIYKFSWKANYSKDELDKFKQLIDKLD